MDKKKPVFANPKLEERMLGNPIRRARQSGSPINSTEEILRTLDTSEEVSDPERKRLLEAIDKLCDND